MLVLLSQAALLSLQPVEFAVVAEQQVSPRLPHVLQVYVLDVLLLL